MLPKRTLPVRSSIPIHEFPSATRHNSLRLPTWSYIKAFPERSPFATNMLMATFKTSLADLVIQKTEGREIDWRRNAIFAAFGAVALGGLQWVVYVEGFKRLFPACVKFASSPWAQKLKDRAGQKALIGQTVVDNFVWAPFGYFPLFYVFKESIQGGDDFEISWSRVKSGLSKWRDNFFPDAAAMAMVFVPADILIFTVPMWVRLPLCHSIGFAWCLVLSAMRGGKIEDKADEDVFRKRRMATIGDDEKTAIS